MSDDKSPEKSLINRSSLLLDRLERITSDSAWAHQASGVRASLAKCLTGESPDPDEINALLLRGFQILEKAASEIPEEIN